VDLFRGLQKSENAALGQKMLFPDGHGVLSETVGFGTGQGLSVFATAGIAGYSEDCKKAKTPPWAKRCCFRMDTS
jgi:hypothetical protein